MLVKIVNPYALPLDIPYANRVVVQKILGRKDHPSIDDVLGFKPVKGLNLATLTITVIRLADVRSLIRQVAETTKFPPPGRAWALLSCVKRTNKIVARVKLEATESKPETVITMRIPYSAFADTRYYIERALPNRFSSRENTKGNFVYAYPLRSGANEARKCVYTSRRKDELQDVITWRVHPVQECVLTNQAPTPVWYLEKGEVERRVQVAPNVIALPRTQLSITDPATGAPYLLTGNGWEKVDPTFVARTTEDAKRIFVSQVYSLIEDHQRQIDKLTDFVCREEQNA